MISIFSYYGTENLGDAIQTVAMIELLEEIGVEYRFRERDSGFGEGDVMLCNGYLDGRWKPVAGQKHIFAGVYCQSLEIAEKVAKHASGTVGCRDPWTYNLMQKLGVPAEMIGCATLTLKRPEVPRNGKVYICNGGDLEQRIPKNMGRMAQIWKAKERIALLYTVEGVWTDRLHITLPCLALNTWVEVDEIFRESVSEPQRFTLLDAFGFEYGKPQQIDVSGWAANYRRFIREAIGWPEIVSRKPQEAL